MYLSVIMWFLEDTGYRSFSLLTRKHRLGRSLTQTMKYDLIIENVGNHSLLGPLLLLSKVCVKSYISISINRFTSNKSFIDTSLRSK